MARAASIFARQRAAPGRRLCRLAGSRVSHVDHDVARDRRRRGGAGIAVLHHHRDGVARRVIRRVANEQRVRPEFPRQLRGIEIAVLALLRARLGAPAWSRSCRPSARPGSGSRASGAVPPGSFTTAHMPSRTICSSLSGRPSEGQSPGRAGLQHAADRACQMRLHCAPGGDPCRIGRELQRRGLEEALADAVHDGIAEIPGKALGRCATRGSGSSPCARPAARYPASRRGRSGWPWPRSDRCPCAAPPHRKTHRNCSSCRRAGRASHGRPCSSNGTACCRGRDSPDK